MTFSIVARDPKTGALGVAAATGGPVVGSLVPHARARVGAIATQSHTNPYYGFDGLDLLARGASAEAVVEKLVAADSDRDIRQCIIIDSKGHTAAWTGPSCTPEAAARATTDLAVAGNLLATTAVLDAMLEAFATTGGGLEDRLLGALAVGQATGGDKRGTTSAALKVFTTELYPAIDLRADWSPAPIDELARILEAVRGADYAGFFESVPSRPV